MVHAFFKRNGILVLAAGVYLAAVAGVAVGIDRLVFQTAKKERVAAVQPHVLVPELDECLNRADMWRNEAIVGADLAEPEAALREAAEAVVRGPSCVTRIELLAPDESPLVRVAEDKFARFNDATNSLLFRDFEIRREIMYSLPDGSLAGIFRVYLTTPDSGPPEVLADVRALTRRHWRILALCELATTLFAAAVAFGVLLPMRNVKLAIESSTPDRPHFLASPRTTFERLYNRMAREAVLARLQERLGEAIQSGDRDDRELVEEACRRLVDSGAASAVRLTERADGRAARVVEFDPAGARVADPASDPRPATGSVVEFASPRRADASFAIVVALRGLRGEVPEVERDFLERFGAIARGALDAALDRGRSLTRERDRAGINLSRNLGHDLTNIVATSKLELTTLGALVGPNAPPIEGERRRILDEALRGLLDSTRFMQEVVNLYRAYAYLKEPVPEPTDANALVEETVRLFGLSCSNKVALETSLSPEPPLAEVDPRLVKLALFNLFSNAMQAIRRGTGEPAGDAKRSGRILVSTRALPGAEGAPGEVEIAVADDGPGIRNDAGELAEPEEIERIFALGYTRGREGEGEGLGLNWVRTIVEDIHGGTVRAENPPEGGARFALRFRAASPARA